MDGGAKASRTSLVLFAVLAFMLGVSRPASAKLYWIESVSISGPTDEAPLVLNDEQASVVRGHGPGTSWALSALMGTRGTIAAPSFTSLGPSFSITWRLHSVFDRVEELHQTLYPYALDGPVTFTEEQEAIFGDMENTTIDVPRHWARFPTRLLSRFEYHGLRAAPTPDMSRGETETPAWPTTLVSGLILTVLCRGGMRKRARTRQRRTEVV